VGQPATSLNSYQSQVVLVASFQVVSGTSGVAPPQAQFDPSPLLSYDGLVDETGDGVGGGVMTFDKGFLHWQHASSAVTPSVPG
jgi:hypothetical protein